MVPLMFDYPEFSLWLQTSGWKWGMAAVTLYAFVSLWIGTKPWRHRNPRPWLPRKHVRPVEQDIEALKRSRTVHVYLKDAKEPQQTPRQRDKVRAALAKGAPTWRQQQ
jgi:hypothetical protein